MNLRYNCKITKKTKSCHPTDDKDNVMFVKPQMKPKRFEGKCYKCDKKGHKISECWIKSEKWCAKSKSKTHNTKDCRSGKNDSAKTATEPKKEEIKEEIKEDNNEHLFSFTLQDLEDGSRRKPQNSNLLVDTRATSHIINDSSKFVSFDTSFDSSSHFMELANGSKANIVLGKGNANVKLFDVRGNLHNVMLHNALYIPYTTKTFFQFQQK